MSLTAVCTGSFDPVTCGHEDIIQRAAALFDKVWVCVLNNHEKSPCFTVEERLNMCRSVFRGRKNIEVISYEGMAVDIFTALHADVFIRGIRSCDDVGYELDMADVNRYLHSGAETLFLPCRADLRGISSRSVKLAAASGGDLTGYIPECIKSEVSERLK